MRPHLWLMVFMAWLLMACGTTPASRYYVLNGAVPETGAQFGQTAQQLNIGLAAIELPGYLDQTRMVRRTGPNTLSIEQFDRWTEPLDKGVQRVLAANLSDLLGARVHRLPWPRGVNQDFLLLMQVAQFDAHEDGSVVLAGTWLLSAGRDNAREERRSYRVEVASQGRDSAAVAAAMSEALAQLARQMAEVIGQETSFEGADR